MFHIFRDFCFCLVYLKSNKLYSSFTEKTPLGFEKNLRFALVFLCLPTATSAPWELIIENSIENMHTDAGL